MRPERMPLSTPQSMALSAATLLLLLVATTALGPLIAGSAWWWAAAFTGAAVLAAGAGLRALRTPPSLVPPLEIVALLLVLTLLFGGATSFALVIPTLDTFDEFLGLAEGAVRTIEQQSVPAIPVPALVFALAVGVGVVAVLLDVIVQTVRLPALAAVPVLVPVLVPGLFVEPGADGITLVLTAATYLLLLRIDVRVRRSAELAQEDDRPDSALVTAPRHRPIVSTAGASLGLAAIGLVAASVVTAATPSVSTSFLLGAGGPGTMFARGVSPYVELGRDLRRPDPVPAFSYVSPDADRPYFTLLNVERLEGDLWTAEERAVDGDHTIDTLPRPDGLAEDVLVENRELTVQIGQVRTAWLPLPYPAAEVRGLRGSWFWDDGSLTVRSVDATTLGQRYEVTRLAVQPTVEQLRGAGEPPAGSVAIATRELPDDLPAVIGETAASVTQGARSRYDAAVAIQAFLRSSEFEYSEEAPVDDGYDGGGFDVIAEFLERRAGYCVHFSSTMAVMAREVGIPSRIAVGYTAGTPSNQRIEGMVRVDVDSHDLHAWPELYFEGVGWVPFEPTPGRGTVPAYSRPNAGEESPGVVPTAPAATPEATGRPEGDPDRLLADQGGGAAGIGTGWLGGAGLAALAVLVVLLPAGIRAGQRAARRRGIRSGASPADAAWRELTATALDFGVEVDERRTARALAAQLAERPGFAASDGDGAAALLRLRDAVERERYGRVLRSSATEPTAGGPVVGVSRDALAEDLATARSALAADAPAARRVEAVLLPRSLRAAGRALLGRSMPRGA
ncbi:MULTISPECIES: transglutaminase family protein [unclassified Agromyces]|uniref:transglutaminase family protein n=1 Tax=unclassified Agromyces TaxID=2639701 RepID=UPI003014F65B